MKRRGYVLPACHSHNSDPKLIRENSRIAWYNGKFMPESQVLIPFRDRGWRYGDGAFDMTRTFNGRAFRLKEHIDRFYRSLRYRGWSPD